MVREFGMNMYTLLYLKWITTKVRPFVQHRELCPMSCGSLDGRGVCRRMDTCMCMAESLCCSPETITTWLIGYSPKTQVQKEKEILGRYTVKHKCCKPCTVGTCVAFHFFMYLCNFENYETYNFFTYFIFYKASILLL